jgi:hypothetical protein
VSFKYQMGQRRLWSAGRPLKFALSLFGLMAPRLRLSLVEAVEKTKREVAGIVARLCNDLSASMIGRIDKPLGAWRRAS